jgi:hypothetical protein
MSIGTISNGESGLSVRTKLNQVINVVNTGITGTDYYVTGGTYNNSTGTLTLNRQNGSLNVTGFVTGVTETQNLTNVLGLGNTTGANDIIVEDGQKIESVSGNTAIEFVSDTELNISTTDGTNTTTQTIEPSIITSLVTDGTNNSQVRVQPDNVFNYSSDGTGESQIEVFPTQISMSSLDGSGSNSIISVIPNQMTLSTTDGTNQTTQLMGITDFEIGTTDGLSSVGIVADMSQFNCELYDDNVGTTSSFGLQTSQSQMSATDGTNTSTQTIQPDNINLSSTDGNTTSKLEFDPLNNYNGTRIEQRDSIDNNTSITFATDQSFWGGESSDGSYGNGMVSAGEILFELVDTGATQTSFLYLSSLYNSLTSTVGDLRTQILLDPSGDIDQTLIGDYNDDTGEYTEIRLSPDSNSGFVFQVGDGVTSNTFGMTKDLFTIQLPAFDDDTDAGLGGLSAGNMYQTSGSGASPLNVAGIVMVKQ